MTRHDLAAEIADCGGWEAFHQKRHEYEMYDYYKGRRKRLEREYRARFNA